MRDWLTGAFKDGGAALAFACLIGVQRISKESIFSGLNNLAVRTPLDARSDERFGFTQVDVKALVGYLDAEDGLPELKEWYDGYRFGDADIYNPWSVLNYLDNGCRVQPYWVNTSGNSAVAEALAIPDVRLRERLYGLLEPDGRVAAPLDLAVAFPDVGARGRRVEPALPVGIPHLRRCGGTRRGGARLHAAHPQPGGGLGVQARDHGPPR